MNFTSTPLNIEVMMTYNCNFRCAYCYEKGCNYENKNISDDTLKNLHRYINWFLSSNPNSTISLNFWGGEPTLQIDKIRGIVYKYLDEPRISFIIITNGSNIDPVIDLTHICNLKQSDKFKPQISYDFACHDRRIMKSGASSKELVKKSIKKFIDSKEQFFMKSTILYDDLDKIEQYYDEYKQLEKEFGCNLSLGITPDTTCTWNKTEEEFDWKIKQFRCGLLNILRKVLKNGEENFNFFTAKRELCAVGNNYFCIDIDGSIYPCHGVIYLPKHEQYKLGHISELKSFNLPFNTFKEPEKCIKCDACLCYRCNAHSMLFSPLKEFKDKWTDHGRNDHHCRIHKEISKFQYAYKKLIKEYNKAQ